MQFARRMGFVVTVSVVACGGGTEPVDPVAAAHESDAEPDGIYGAWVLESDPSKGLNLAKTGRYLYSPQGNDYGLYRGTFTTENDRITWENDLHARAYAGDTARFSLARDDRGDVLTIVTPSDTGESNVGRWRRR
jgi:hypothetical protein